LTDFLEPLDKREHLEIRAKPAQLDLPDLRDPKGTAARQETTEFPVKSDVPESPESVDRKEDPVAPDRKVSRVFPENLDDQDPLDLKAHPDLPVLLDLRADQVTKESRDFPARWVDQA